MTLVSFAMWIVVGLLATVLGLAGSSAVAGTFDALGLLPDAGLGVLVIVAFIGGAIPIMVQRWLWPVIV